MAILEVGYRDSKPVWKGDALTMYNWAKRHTPLSQVATYPELPMQIRERLEQVQMLYNCAYPGNISRDTVALIMSEFVRVWK